MKHKFYIMYIPQFCFFNLNKVLIAKGFSRHRDDQEDTLPPLVLLTSNLALGEYLLGDGDGVNPGHLK